MVAPSDERSARRERLQRLTEAGVVAYPGTAHRTHTCEQAGERFEKLLGETKDVALVGRIRSLRRHGGATFCHLEDGTGRFQLFFKRDVFGDRYALLDLLDLGDFLEASGKLFLTKRGERTLLAHDFRLLAKALRPLPEKWHGLTDLETRYRKRELDLLANPSVRLAAAIRAKTIETIRSFFTTRGYLEVETPILQPTPGGANARPFATHHEALDADLSLRIAPELYLKRLLVGGLERVFEVGRSFRNEGIDRMHNPEFTTVEAYEAYANAETYLELVEALFVAVLRETKQTLAIEFAGQRIDFTPPYPRVTFVEALKEHAKLDAFIGDDRALVAEAKRRGVEVGGRWGRGRVLDEVYRSLVRPQLIQPTFLTGHPIELSPLAKRRASDPRFAERFQLIAGGVELVNAFSELNDPLDQRQRFLEQEKLRKAGHVEAHPFDEDFLEALEYGMPPAAGLGIGIDRLVALLTNAPSLKEVILFPTLKPKPHRGP